MSILLIQFSSRHQTNILVC